MLCTRETREDTTDGGRGPREVRELLGADADGIPWVRGRGCGRCSFTGYHGQVAVGEPWVPGEENVALITQPVPVETLRRAPGPARC